MTSNKLTLAVAGSGKTQMIVDECRSLPLDERVLILTYTTNNQSELVSRLARDAGDHHYVTVTGWFAFLLGHFVRPFLPYLYEGRRLRGFDFKSEYQTYVGVEEFGRYFTKDARARKVHLAQLASRINTASSGAPIRNITRLYDRIYIDEVQDLCGYDLEILLLLMGSAAPLTMVGDVRQAVIVTSEQEKKHSKYKFMGIWDWFREQEKAGRIVIDHLSETRRCRPEIAAFADSLFAKDLGFSVTSTSNSLSSGHDGIYLVPAAHVEAYIDEFSPMLLKDPRTKVADIGRPIGHLRTSKGLEANHVLIWPTDRVKALIKKGTPLDRQQAAVLYVGVTRARYSVAFVGDDWGSSAFPVWTEPAEG